jgi:hypothetical protein
LDYYPALTYLSYPRRSAGRFIWLGSIGYFDLATADQKIREHIARPADGQEIRADYSQIISGSIQASFQSR